MLRYVLAVVGVLSLVAGAGSVVAGMVPESVPQVSRWVLPLARGAADSPALATPPPLLKPAPVKIDSPGFWSWALLHTRTGKLVGSDNFTETSTTASMIKAWLVADYLRMQAEAGRTPSQTWMRKLSDIIRWSHNDYTQELFQSQVGKHESINRLISICGLTDSSPFPGYWSKTSISARDTARMAACIADGRAAGPQWTEWVLNEMRNVRSPGDFGIIKALPPEVQKQTAIKNGWLLRDETTCDGPACGPGNWHISCMAIGDGWTLGVLTRYPGRLGMEHGENICQSVAAQLLQPAG
ncbi:MAG: hypothetical protein FWJ93_02660 [Micromonosporaceae bacterium]